MLTDFTTAHHYVECGEECRHNDRRNSIENGFGHVMFLRIKKAVQPVSRGYLVDETDPDYPPLCFACDDARRQDGVVIWCHNGRGMEAPVAAALGKLDAINLFDPYWMDPEYDLWYALLNCGCRLPASTGSDWFICSANRVYADIGKAFQPEDWFAALSAGKTFITNGPALFLHVDGKGPGEELASAPGHKAEVSVAWESFYAVQQVQVVRNGSVVYERHLQDEEESYRGRMGCEVEIPEDGWIAARLGSHTRDSFFQPIYAHTSPIYVRTGVPNARAGTSARMFAHNLEAALEWIAREGRFDVVRQRDEVTQLFKQGKAIYESIARTGHLPTEEHT